MRKHRKPIVESAGVRANDEQAAAMAAATTESIRRLRAEITAAERRGDRAEAERLRADLEVRVELVAHVKRRIRPSTPTREVRR